MADGLKERLRKRQTPTLASESTALSVLEKRPAKSNAERAKEHYARIKESRPDVYSAKLENQKIINERKRNYMKLEASEDEKNQAKEKHRQRMREWRRKKAMEAEAILWFITRTMPGPSYEAGRLFTEQLVAQVRNRPCLYNTASPGYKDRSIVDAEWEDLAKTLNCTVDGAKKRWQNVRSSYGRSRAVKALPGGSHTRLNKRRSQFYLADEISFLDPFMPALQSQGLDSVKPELLVFEDDDDEDSESLEEEEEPLSPPSQAPSSPPPASPQPSHHHLQHQQQQQQRRQQQQQHFHTASDAQDLSPGLPITNGKRKRRASGETEPKIARTSTSHSHQRVAEGASTAGNPDMEKLKGLLPYLADLSAKRKRLFLRTIYNMLFDMLDEQDSELEIEKKDRAPSLPPESELNGQDSPTAGPNTD